MARKSAWRAEGGESVLPGFNNSKKHADKLTSQVLIAVRRHLIHRRSTAANIQETDQRDGRSDRRLQQTAKAVVLFEGRCFDRRCGKWARLLVEREAWWPARGR